jgi:hypothetical protein
MPLPENCCSTSLFTTVYKRLTEGRIDGFLIGWLRAACEAAAASCCVGSPEQLSVLRTLYVGFRKATLKKS